MTRNICKYSKRCTVKDASLVICHMKYGYPCDECYIFILIRNIEDRKTKYGMKKIRERNKEVKRGH